jgi:hypothetical protein
MTDEDYNQIREELIKMFGDRLPNPEHEPIQFHYYLKMYNFQRQLQNGAG